MSWQTSMGAVVAAFGGTADVSSLCEADTATTTIRSVLGRVPLSARYCTLIAKPCAKKLPALRPGAREHQPTTAYRCSTAKRLAFGMPPPSQGALAQTAAVSVATILGSGILGLPVSLARSGLPPFLAAFTLTCVAQVAVVYATTELLQRATAAKRAGAAGAASARRAAYRPLPYQTATAKWSIEDGDGSSGGGGATAGRDELAPAERGDSTTRTVGEGGDDASDDVFCDVGVDDCAAPGLHAFAELYLPTLWLKVLFELAVLFHFVSIMSSYALGAPQAFREVFPFLKVIPETGL